MSYISNEFTLSSDYDYFILKQKHMKNTISYRKIIKKVIKSFIIPDVLEKIIFNFVGSSQFPSHLSFYYVKTTHELQSE